MYSTTLAENNRFSSSWGNSHPWLFPTLSSLRSRKGTTEKYSPKGTPGCGAVNCVSNDATSVALACRPIAEGSGTEQLSQQSVGMPTSEIKETNGGIGDGYAMNDKTETGVWGPDGLLAVPHVKMVLSLVCVVQVR